MFTDLVGSTELASALDPEDWHDVLNAYQHRVAAIVTAHGGVIAQFQGDGAVAYFGYPEAQESASRDAAVGRDRPSSRTSSGLGSELPDALGISDLQARVGIHTGEVLVAAVTAGGQERLPDVWGQVPNMAARLQAVGAPGQIVISGADGGPGRRLLRPGASRVPHVEGHRAAGARLPRPPAERCTTPPRGSATRPRSFPADAASDWLERAVVAGRERGGSDGPGLGRTGHREVAPAARVQRRAGRQGTRWSRCFCSRRGSLSPLQPFGEVMGHVPATPQEAAAWVEDAGRRGTASCWSWRMRTGPTPARWKRCS